ncbi:thiamine pyrophosphate-dependent enzyme [Corynebacterium aquatimens]|uniref:acetolactate synthase n=1 Tax=Corynebacterium aquatimens TaxID=1190508 RepID=A0A931GVE3_9CORY|nr:thiamine pyrophosphate-dependent enzyme [Corynebacterium aquatimens]MBG6121141.1 acetolactate synthase-1/2/3 large subunit [Corynebacterium aquatimens]
MHVGSAIAQTLQEHGVSHAFVVPGESYLALLDGLYDSAITPIICRHEGGAAYMADAYGKATGTPGVVMTTRGPGAANAKIGVYAAWQDAVPLVMFVGLIPQADRYRESFQEFDPNMWFDDITKGVFVVDDPQRASGIVSNAFFLAQSGRPGPVVVGLPEDVLTEEFTGQIAPPITVSGGAVSDEDLDVIAEQLARAQRPLILEGGQGWTPDACAALQHFAETHQIPVVNDTRSSDRISFDSPAYAGWLGTARSDDTAELLNNADLLITIGGVLWDKPTDNFSLRQDYDATNIVITPDTTLRGHSGAVTRHIIASPEVFAQSLERLEQRLTAPDAGAAASAGDSSSTWFTTARAIQEDFSRIPAPGDRFDEPDGTADFYDVMAELTARLPDDAIATFGAGNHCFWPQRFFPTRQYPSMIANRLGSMGYSLPAGIAAKLAFPDRFTVVFTGDGEFMMNGNELITAVRYDTPLLIVLLDNAQYGTIRAHQEKHYPDRVVGTQLENPDFCVMAEACGAWGRRVDNSDEIPAVLDEAIAQVEGGRVALVHVVVAQDQAAPRGSKQA